MMRPGSIVFLATFLAVTTLGAQPSTIPARACGNQKLGRRTGVMLVYHAGDRRVLLFGGRSGGLRTTYPGSLWAWNGVRWQCIAADGPPGRTDGEMVYDARRNRVVLYGGRGARLFRDTWEWDGERWTLADSVGPPPRIHMVLTYDPARRTVLMHGGLGRPGPDQFLRDSWEWDGARWRPVRIASSAAPGDHHVALVSTPQAAMLMDAAPDSTSNCLSDSQYQRARVRLFVLRDSAWASLNSPGPCVSGGTPTVWTPNGIVLFAEWDAANPGKAAETWLWRAGVWQRAASAPPRRRGSRMVYDAGRDRVVLFGGNTDAGVLDDTWEWDGAGWARVRPR